MKYLIKISLVLLLLGVTLFAKDVAKVTGLSGSASIDRSGSRMEATLGISLKESDIITTSDSAKMQIIFKDETIISLGKNTNFSIKEYLFEETQAPVAKFAMLKGAMRTITGKIGEVAPDKFSVEAKTATIGIRGTNFSVLVGEDETVQVYCTFGAISVNVSGVDNIVNQGFYIVVAPDGSVDIKEFSSQDLKEMKEENFAKSESKSGDAIEDVMASNETQLDNTREEFDNIVIKDISDSVVDAEHTGGTGLASLIAGYTMSDALYTGTISNVADIGYGLGLANGQEARLEVDFGADRVSLRLGQDLMFDENPSIDGASFSVDPHGYNGSASGEFGGATGQSASGTFSVDDGADGNTGNFDVSTEQVLH